jgi:hypothetical protein
MSRKEIDRMEVVRRVLERRLSQVKAAELIGLSTRQVRRLSTAYEQLGPTALASRKRGRGGAGARGRCQHFLGRRGGAGAVPAFSRKARGRGGGASVF